MPTKEPVLLTVLIETDQLRWYVAGISLSGNAIPLMRSTVGNLKPYLGVALDEQVNFLRHRLSGVLQRGCDRLWGRVMKPCHVVFVADNLFQHAEPELTQRVGDHFVVWMANPPVAFFVSENGFSESAVPMLRQVAGELPDEYRTALETGLPKLFAARQLPDAWEDAPEKTSL
jgi:hypothetical protein